MIEVEIDEDIARAAGPPPAVYVDPAMHEVDRRRVLGRTWQLVARDDQLAQVGSFVTVEVAGEPVVIVRAAAGDGGLRGYANVCPHRAGPLAAGCGQRRTIQCGYHGWTFDLEGRLLRAPDADPGEVRLAPVQVAAWGPLVLASIAPVMAASELLAGIAAPPPMPFVLRRAYPVACNWKVYVDNYLEGYHIPIVHPELARELDLARYRTETARWWSRQHAPVRGDAQVYRPEHQADDAEYDWVFPNLMLNIYQGQLQTNLVVPLSADRTLVIFDWYAADGAAVDPERDPRWSELIRMSELLQAQDAAICETVQKNPAPTAPAGPATCPATRSACTTSIACTRSCWGLA